MAMEPIYSQQNRGYSEEIDIYKIAMSCEGKNWKQFFPSFFIMLSHIIWHKQFKMLNVILLLK